MIEIKKHKTSEKKVVKEATKISNNILKHDDYKTNLSTSGKKVEYSNDNKKLITTLTFNYAKQVLNIERINKFYKLYDSYIPSSTSGSIFGGAISFVNREKIVKSMETADDIRGTLTQCKQLYDKKHYNSIIEEEIFTFLTRVEKITTVKTVKAKTFSYDTIDYVKPLEPSEGLAVINLGRKIKEHVAEKDLQSPNQVRGK